MVVSGTKKVIRQDPAFKAEESANGSLFDVRIFGFELVCEAETNDRETGYITFWVILRKLLVDIGTSFMN
jgi:hypothetical protein